MQSAVQSAKLESKKEIAMETLETYERFNFSCSEMRGKSYKTKNSELLAIYYADILREFTESIESTFEAPIADCEADVELCLEKLLYFSEKIAALGANNLQCDTTPAVELKESVK